MDFLASGDINGIYGQFVNVCDGCGGDFANDPGPETVVKVQMMVDSMRWSRSR